MQNYRPQTPEEEPSEIEQLEARVRKELGDEAVDERLEQANEEIVPTTGWGDMPKGYDREKDPLHKRRKEVAREITIKGIALGLGIAAIGGAVVYAKRRFENKKDSEEE